MADHRILLDPDRVAPRYGHIPRTPFAPELVAARSVTKLPVASKIMLNHPQDPGDVHGAWREYAQNDVIIIICISSP